MKFYIQKEYDEQCGNCGYIRGKEENLPHDGAPISGMYYICPKCHKEWHFNMKEINIKEIHMVRMTKEEYEELKMNKSGSSQEITTEK